MKKFILSAIAILTTFTCFSQEQTKLNFYLSQAIHTRTQRNRLVTILVKGNISTIKALTKRSGGSFKYSAGDIAVVRIPVGALSSFVNNSKILRMEGGPHKIVALNDTMRLINDIDKVQSGTAPLPQAYTGKGVLMGIIDTGIDYKHPDFTDSTTGKTRILYMWNQAEPVASNTPQPYGYGEEWDSTAINNGTAPDTIARLSYGHGTHVAGIAAGNGNASANHHERGVAPSSDIIEVSIDPNNNSPTLISDAVNYIFTKADQLGEPCVINISMGDYYGSHDGTDLQAQLIDSMLTAKSGRVIVASAGNAGSVPYHLGYNVGVDTTFTWFKYDAGYGFAYINVWADTSAFKNVQFTVGADKHTPDYSFRGQLPFTNISNLPLGTLGTDTLYNNGNRIGVVQYYAELVGGSYSLEYAIVADSTSYYWRFITTGSGKFDAWSFDLIASGLPSSTTYPDMVHYKAPDTKETIVSSFQCLSNVITVGSYNSRQAYMDYDSVMYADTSIHVGTIASYSSMGPTRDGRIKPDITSGSDMVMSCVTLSLDSDYISWGQSYKLGIGGYYIRDAGTSSAAPVVAGVAALYLEQHPTATCQEVKNAIISCAKQDQFTGSNLPDNVWGYGKVDGFKALSNCGLTGINNTTADNKSFALDCYPNPFNNFTTIHYDISPVKSFSQASIKVYNVLGEKVKTINLNHKSGSIILNKGQLRQGIYFYNLSVDGKTVKTKKLIIL